MLGHYLEYESTGWISKLSCHITHLLPFLILCLLKTDRYLNSVFPFAFLLICNCLLFRFLTHTTFNHILTGEGLGEHFYQVSTKPSFQIKPEVTYTHSSRAAEYLNYVITPSRANRFINHCH